MANIYVYNISYGGYNNLTNILAGIPARFRHHSYRTHCSLTIQILLLCTVWAKLSTERIRLCVGKAMRSAAGEYCSSPYYVLLLLLLLIKMVMIYVKFASNVAYKHNVRCHHTCIISSRWKGQIINLRNRYQFCCWYKRPCVWACANVCVCHVVHTIYTRIFIYDLPKEITAA